MLETTLKPGKVLEYEGISSENPLKIKSALEVLENNLRTIKSTLEHCYKADQYNVHILITITLKYLLSFNIFIFICLLACVG